MYLEERVKRLEDTVFNNRDFLTLEEVKSKGLDYYEYCVGVYKYIDKDNIKHLIQYDKELCKGKFVHWFEKDVYEYQDENNIYHKCILKNGKEYEVKE